MTDVRAAPRASALVESMRDLGYSLETALADIIDNSITADAVSIGIFCDIFCDAGQDDPVIAIIDNGHGMSDKELIAAMRPGSRNPLEDRAENDLGRFGLGLKTASFSQCRRLTVVTRKDGQTHAARWDLDYVAQRDDWLIQIPTPDEASTLPFVDRLGPTGTLVLWQKLDRLTETATGSALKDHLYAGLDEARKHLELVFHRFLDGERPFRKVAIAINGDPLEAFDPFNARHRATQRLPEEEIRIKGCKVCIQPFILPHHKKVSPKIWEKYGGDAGYLKNQGFYVYRAGRLIIYGTWFRLAKQTELTKLARVRIDMPTELDHLWKIDVKKASARPPFVVLQRLKGIIDRIAGASNRVYTARGKKLLDPSITPVWIRRVDKNEIFYEVNRDHPLIVSFAAEIEQDQRNQLTYVLQAIEKSFPIDVLFSDLGSQPEAVSPGIFPEETLRELVKLTYHVFRGQGLNSDVIQETLRKTEPYRSNWDITERVLSDLTTGAIT